MDTKPELALRSLLHRRGHRFRKDFVIRAGTIRTRPDIAFTRQRVAVYVDGCYWHCCPQHRTIPRSNRDYWLPKLERNVERDRQADATLRADGWTVVRIWEHESPVAAAERVEAALTSGLAPPSH